MLTVRILVIVLQWGRILFLYLKGEHLSKDFHIYAYFEEIHTYILTYLLTPWSRVLLEKLTDSAASQEIPRIFGTRRFLAVLTSARHLSLSSANSIQSPQTPPTSWRFILILSSHLRLGFPQTSPPGTCAHLSPPPYAPHALPISSSRFYRPYNFG